MSGFMCYISCLDLFRGVAQLGLERPLGKVAGPAGLQKFTFIYFKAFKLERYLKSTRGSQEKKKLAGLLK